MGVADVREMERLARNARRVPSMRPGQRKAAPHPQGRPGQLPSDSAASSPPPSHTEHEDEKPPGRRRGWVGLRMFLTSPCTQRRTGSQGPDEGLPCGDAPRRDGRGLLPSVPEEPRGRAPRFFSRG